MALIECPECSEKISNEVKTCPKCGYMIVKPKRTFFGNIIFGVNIIFGIVMLSIIINIDTSIARIDVNHLQHSFNQQDKDIATIGISYIILLVIWLFVGYTLYLISKKKQ